MVISNHFLSLEVQEYQMYSPQFGMIKIPEPKTLVVFGPLGLCKELELSN